MARKRIGIELQKNANLLTGFVVAIILVSGIGITSGRQSWYVTALVVGGLFVGLFFFLNARAVIKAGLATLTVAFSAQVALVLGSVVEPTRPIGILWMLIIVSLYLAVLALSYLLPGTRSRWTGGAIAILLSLPSAAVLADLVGVEAGLWASFGLGLIVFLAYYRGIGMLFEHRSSMPKAEITEEQEERLIEAVEAEGWSVRRLEKRQFRKAPLVSYLVWSEKRAYVLHPVVLNGKLAVSPGRKTSKLVHNGYSINTWLLRTSQQVLPAWLSRNAPMMLVLLDVKSLNGVTPEAIGVALPDTTKKLPVGIYPSKGVVSSTIGKSKAKKSKGFMADLDSHYSSYVPELKTRHVEALRTIGLRSESEYLEAEDETKSISA